MSFTPVVANHADPEAFWQGGEYELNLSYGTLRDIQWGRLMEAIWDHADIEGPFTERYTPGRATETTAVQTPEQTATWIQYGRLRVADDWVGCAVQATRSLFECVTVQVPLGMFEGLVNEHGAALNTDIRLDELEHVFQDMALTAFDAVPFELANIGYLCECQLVTELQFDTEKRLQLFANGNFFVRDDIMQLLRTSPTDYPTVRTDLRWASPRSR